jgi:hypothetical protein
VLPVFPIIPCVFIPVFSVCCQFVMFCQVNQCGFPFLFFSSPLGSDLCLPSTLSPPAWPFSLPWPRACLPLCTSWTLNWFWPFACPQPFSCLPLLDCLINIKNQTICLPCLHLGLTLCPYTITNIFNRGSFPFKPINNKKISLICKQ